MPSSPPPASTSAEGSTSTLSTYLASQASLLQEASLALPHQFTHCTYAKGYLRQSVYLCLTCALPLGICSSCSIACHTDHEQLELFPKRHFRCDCPTGALPCKCTLHEGGGDEGVGREGNEENVYGPNFRGVFCRCGRKYEALREKETMVQCLACEDWFHESCLHLRDRPPSRDPTPTPDASEPVALNTNPSDASSSLPTTNPPPSSTSLTEEAEVDDASSTTSDPSLPPALLTSSDYDTLICGSCVSRIPILRRYAGTNGVKMVVKESVGGEWKVLDGEGGTSGLEVQVEVDGVADGVDGKETKKRPLSPTSHSKSNDAKRARTSPPSTSALIPNPSSSSSKPTCLAPPPNPLAQSLLAGLKFKNPLAGSSTGPDAESSGTGEGESLTAGDIFLTESWRERWCRCESCLAELQAHPYLLEEKETYEPPEDPDSQLSLEELGLRALERIPRERAIDGIRAFNDMRDDLLTYLRPFAQEGKVVGEGDIKAFFEERKREG